jgi:hypothetical protein
MEAGPLNQATPSFEQTMPFTVLSHTLVGGQEVVSNGVRTYAEAGEIFLVQSNVPMRITQCPDERRQCRAEWLHVYFTLFGTIDFVGFLELPPKVNGVAAERLGEIIAELVDPSLLGESRFPYGFVRRREMA